MLGHALEGAGVPQGRNVSYLGDLLLAMETRSTQVGATSFVHTAWVDSRYHGLVMVRS